jgi:outer membrane receptor protein involved in Fe transport
VKTGNPNLKPFLANSYDLAYEYYPMRGAILSVAVSRKDIISLVASTTLDVPFSGRSVRHSGQRRCRRLRHDAGLSSPRRPGRSLSRATPTAAM